MSDGRVDKTSPYQHKASASSSQGSLSYPVRRMRNTAVLVKWIEEHQTNPYPTKAEKQYLAYYSGMNLTQLSTWFANARRRIKKIGMKTWLEGRSTFTVDFFPSSTLSRPAMPADAYAAATGGAYHTLSPASPYAYPTLTGIPNSYTAQHHSPIGLQTTSQRLNGSSSVYTDTSSMHHGTSSSSINGLYGAGTHSRSLSQPMMMMHPFSNWPMASASPLLPATSVSLQSRQVSNTMPMHSPLTAQVYSADTSHLRTHSAQSLETVSDGPYSLPQHSPDQMLPECASTEPMLQDNQKTQSSITN